MRVRDLGPLVVEDGGRLVELGLTKQAALLSMLALQPGRTVSSDALTAAAWGPDEVVSAARLDSQLWRLRNLLEPGRKRSTSSVLVRHGSGFQLQVDPGSVDSQRFEQAAIALTRSDGGEDLSQRLTSIEEALALWRGQPFESLADALGIGPIRVRYEELRTQLAERRIETLLSLGHLDLALADLQPMIAATPYRERLWAQRMTALDRLGRTEESLAAFRRLRQILIEEIGLEPGQELVQLHARILARDPGDERPNEPAARVLAVGEFRQDLQVSRRLPRRGAALIGREHDQARLQTLIVEQPLVTLTGVGGSGKTRLAVEVAATTADRFPGGVWFVDLSAIQDPNLVIDLVVTTLSLQASPTSEPVRALGEFARGRRMLLVLDNCEHVLDGAAAVIEQLLLVGEDDPPGPAVMATSREPLEIPGEHIWSLAPLSLRNGENTQTLAPAVQLFADRARAAAPDLQFDAESLTVVEQICRALDGLPLAIELAAARVRSLTLVEIATQVSADPSRLTRIGRGSNDHRQSLFDAVEWSYRLLDPEERLLHRWLSVLPGSFARATAVAVVAGHAGSEPDSVADALLRLAHRSLLTADLSASPGVGATFGQLETVRSHAHRRLVEAGELADALAARDRWVAALLARRPRLGRPEAPAWYDEVEAAYPMVRAALQRALEPAGMHELIGLGSGLGFFWYFRYQIIEGSRWLEAAQAAGHHAPGSVEDITIRLRLAGAYLLRFRADLARPHLAVALSQVDDLSPRSQVMVAEAAVTAAGGAWTCQAFDLVADLGQALVTLASALEDETVQLFAEMVACVASLPEGSLERTGVRAEVLYERSVTLGNLLGCWMMALLRCVVATETLNAPDALSWTQKVIGLQQDLGSGGSKNFLESLANCFVLTGDLDRAVQLYSAASTYWAGSRPDHPQTRARFDSARGNLPDAQYEQAWREGERLSIDDLLSWRAATPR